MKLLGLFRAILLLTFLVGQMAGVSVLAKSNTSSAEVRVTTGSYHVAGWERQLVKGNPNLARYTWMPVTGYIQGKARVQQPNGPTINLASQSGQPRRPIYIRPVHVPTVVSRAGQAAPRMQVEGAFRVSSCNWAAKDVSAKLAYKDDSRDVSAMLKDNPEVFTYPSVYGSGDSSGVCGLLERKHVFGKINRLNF
ncbi:MAG: hypothetical protein HY711_04195 [Candidatus Melainabacteria bacterium]|nr:hypothetical protein [Candidatus Melainabacteria bacterium]